MASLKLTLDTRRAKTNKTYPLVFRISLNGQSRDIPTGISIPENYWNSRTHSLKKDITAHEELSRKIKEHEIALLSKIIAFEKDYPSTGNVQNLKDYILSGSAKKKTVIEFWENEILLLRKSNRNGNANIYSETLTALQKIDNMQIPFEKIDFSYLKELEAELLAKGNKLNTISLYLRTLRAIYNKAINSKQVAFEHYPFRNFIIRKEATKPRVLTLDELQKYFNLKLETSSLLYDSWMMGKLMFMLIGINFTDMVLLSKEQLQHGRIFYSRAKTKRQYSIKLLPEAMEVINYFHGRSESTLLGKIKQEHLQDGERLIKEIKQANKVYNNHLEKIGNIISCKEKLTGYCFRYSSANIAKQLGFSKDLIGEALGHSYGSKVTGIYLEAYDLEHIDNLNENVCYAVMRRSKGD
ncbi:MAG: phage integrase SAM-like domain-containing protein [Bacteroidia bacterium]